MFFNCNIYKITVNYIKNNEKQKHSLLHLTLFLFLKLGLILKFHKINRHTKKSIDLFFVKLYLFSFLILYIHFFHLKYRKYISNSKKDLITRSNLK